MRLITTLGLLGFLASGLHAQQVTTYTRADTLRGSFTTPQRSWWDVTFYDLRVRAQPSDSTVRGSNTIVYRVLQPSNELQIDLMTPLEVDSMLQDGKRLDYRREGNAFFVTLTAPQPQNASKALTVFYHGKPIIAKRPPWDGGLTWASDTLKGRWIATSNQGVGASIWWPNKDTQADEPDSQRIAITVPKPMIDVSNGRLRKTTSNKDGTITYEWFVVNPINNYNVAINAGSYAHYTDVYYGEAGKLTLDFYPLANHLEAAKKQWAQDVKPMMQCFEKWFGPYPWYEDGYKLVETPHLGMEHQSAVAYGNKFQNGYLGRDLSGTGVGMKWDFIVVHESAHEWWGNNITTKDVADMWVHESFANYAENLYHECRWGKEEGSTYVLGTRAAIQNDAPIIGVYGVNTEGSGDMYYKGGNMLHTIRQVINDDDKWREILRGLQKTFRHQTIMGKQVEDYISAQSGINLSKVFDQYLRNAQIPVFQYRVERDTLFYRWTSAVSGFDMPLKVTTAPGVLTMIKPKRTWQRMPIAIKPDEFAIDRNFYVGVLR